MAKVKLSALIHVRSESEARHLGRTLETLRPCDEVLLIGHAAGAALADTAREYGAIVKAAIPGVDEGAYALDCRNSWILCLLPNETLSETLEASLLDWKEESSSDAQIGYALTIRESGDNGWHSCGRELRLVNRDRVNWTEALPHMTPNCGELPGDLLRFSDGEGN